MLILLNNFMLTRKLNLVGQMISYCAWTKRKCHYTCLTSYQDDDHLNISKSGRIWIWMVLSFIGKFVNLIPT